MAKNNFICVLMVVFSSIMLSACLGGDTADGPIIFDRVEIPERLFGKYIVTSDGKENGDVALAFEISKKSRSLGYHLSALYENGEYFDEVVFPTPVPGGNNIYVLYMDEQKVFKKLNDGSYRAEIFSNAFFVIRLHDDGAISLLKIPELSKNVSQRYLDIGIVHERTSKYNAEELKNYLINKQYEYGGGKNEVGAFPVSVSNVGTSLERLVKYHKFRSPFDIKEIFGPSEYEAHIAPANVERERQKKAAQMHVSRQKIDAAISAAAAGYLQDSRAYISNIDISGRDKKCRGKSAVNEFPDECYEYIQVMKWRSEKIKTSSYQKKLVSIGDAKLEQGASTQSFTYTTPDRSEIIGNSIYTYKGTTITSYDTSINRYAFLHVPIANDSCSDITVKIEAVFKYNPFKPDDNDNAGGAVMGFIGGAMEGLFRVTVGHELGMTEEQALAGFGVRGASGEATVAKNSVKTLTLELDSSGIVRNGIQMREAKITDATVAFDNPSCVPREFEELSEKIIKMSEFLPVPFQD